MIGIEPLFDDSERANFLKNGAGVSAQIAYLNCNLRKSLPQEESLLLIFV